MSRAVDSIYTILNNPFTYEELFTTFYKNYNNKENDLLLSYLILPLVLNEDSRRKILHLNKKSNLLSLTKDRNSIIGLELMITENMTLTNKCIQLCLAHGYLILGNKMELVRTDKLLSQKVLNDNELSRAVKKIAQLIETYDVVSVYRMLGVKNI